MCVRVPALCLPGSCVEAACPARSLHLPQQQIFSLTAGLPTPPVCGSPVISSHAVDGMDAVYGEWPWQVAVLHENEFTCGGSLINDQWVLSAAHCFKESPEDYTVFLGMYQVGASNPHGFTAEVKKIIKYPLYTMTGDAGDVALVKLVNPVNFTDYIQPICLLGASATLPSGMECWVTGWGTRSYGENIPDVHILHAVMTPLIDSADCDLLHHIGSSVSSAVPLIQSNEVCAGYIEGKKDSCRGDSGGPLVCKVKGIWIQAGVVTWGEGCGFPYRPGVYALVPAYESWIKKYIPNMMFSNVLSPHQLSTAHGVCGFPVISNRITWNTNTVEGEWPWQISIQYLGFHICGGSLISDRWILSAAYCFIEDGNPLHYTVYLGAHDITGKNPYEQVRSVNKIILHPKYSGILSGRDIALVELLEPVHYSSKVLPVCLPAASVTFPCHSECWVTGWANVYSRYNVHNPKTLQKVKVPTIDSERCDRMLFEDLLNLKYNSAGLEAEDTICFGYDEKHSHFCKVGPGDPLVCKVDGIWYQAGIIKRGIRCHSFTSSCPDAYTLVPSFQSWIRAHIPDIIFTVLANDPEVDTLSKGGFGTEGGFGTDGDVTSCSGSPSSVQCGSPGITNLIADTTNAVDGEWPWQVAIQYNGRFICGGSLISEQWVLSAAHCFNDSDFDPKTYNLIMGVCQLSGHMPHAKHSSVMEIIWNPKHKAGGSRGDIALVKLSSPISYTTYIKPICLPAASATFLPDMECWVTGWGTLSSIWSPLSKTLQKVKLPLIDYKQCDQMYHNDSLESTFTNIIQNDKICAGYAEGKKDTCQGDSGGPLVCKIKGKWIQAGIALKRKGCVSSNRPRVYTLVPAYVSWIKRYVPEIRFAS